MVVVVVVVVVLEEVEKDVATGEATHGHSPESTVESLCNAFFN